mgnify:CR=1 FL=1
MFDAIKQGAPSISIHVPLRGGRLIRICMFSAFLQFQSTSPYAGDDRTYTCGRNTRKISIHVPLRGGRLPISCMTRIAGIFQSTSPYAGDDITAASSRGKQITFQSTSPYAGDDYGGEDFTAYTLVFQSTSPYAGDDHKNACRSQRRSYFNPRPPTRGTTRR